MTKVYTVIHYYEVCEEGLGRSCYEDIATFATREEADSFVKKYENPHEYDNTSYLYGELECGKLFVEVVELGEFDESTFWWLKEE